MKSEALTELGNMTWLDSLAFEPYLDSLMYIHSEIPAWNSSLVECGIYAAKGQYSALEILATSEMLSSECPELYDLLKRVAQAEQATGWSDGTAVDLTWLTELGAQRDVIGSAAANAWLHALGGELPEEIIILPEDGAKRLETRTTRTVEWPTDLSMEVFPNPSNGPVMVAYEVPEGVANAELRLMDVHGRFLKRMRVGEGPGLVQLTTEALSSGVYLTDLSLDGIRVAQQKVVVQH